MKTKSSQVSTHVDRGERVQPSSLYLASLIDNISDALISTDLQFKILEWNAAAENMYGWTAAEVMGHPLQEFVRNEYLETTREAVIQSVSEQGIWKGEVTQNRKDGTRFPVLASVSLVKDQAGKPVGFVAVNRDITERKQAEEKLKQSEEYLRMGYDAADLGIWRNDLQTGAVEFDERARIHYGFDTRYTTLSEVMNRVDPDDLARLQSEIGAATAPDGSGKFATEYRVIHADGSVHWLAIGVQVLFDGEGAQRRALVGYGTTQDITTRKRAEMQIVQMKRLYATLSQVNQTIVRVKDRADLYQSICDVAVQFGEFAVAWVGLLNAETGDITPVASNGVDLAHWPFPHVNVNEDVFKNGLIATALHTYQVITSEDVVTDERTGHLQTSFVKNNLHSSAVIPFHLRGAPVGILKLISHEADLFESQEELLLLKEMGGDISFALETMETEAERGQAEDKLRENISRLELAMQSANMAWWEMNITTGDVTFSERKAKMLGYPPEQFKHYSDFMALVHPEDSDKAMNAMRGHIDGISDKYEVEYRILTKSEGYKSFYDLGSIVKRDSNGTPLTATGLVIDITARKQAEAERSQLTERLDLATHAAQMGIWDWHIEKNELVWDDRMYALYGLKPGEFGGAYEAWLNGVHPDDRESSNEVSQQAVRGEKNYDTEFRVVWPDGSVHWLKANGQVFRDEAGKPVRMVGVNYDITARKQAEERLRESEQLFSKIFTDSPVAISMVSVTDGKNIEVNDAWCRLTGFSREEAIGHDTGELKIFSQEERNRLIKAFSNQGYSKHVESEITTKNGKKKNIIMSSELITTQENRYILVSVIDITERKQAEKQLHESERNLKLFVEYAPAAIAMFDRDMKYIAASRRFLADYNLKDENVIGRSHYEIFPEISERWKEIHRRCLAGATEKEEEDPFPRLDGTLDWVRWEIHPWNDKSGEIGGIILFSEVITERKQAESQIQRQLRQLNSLHTIDQAISANSGMKETLDIILQQVKEQLGIDAAAILLADEQRELLECVACQGFRSLEVRHTQLELSEGYAGRSVRERQMIHIPNLLESGGSLAESLKAGGDDLLDYYCTPLVSREKILGVLEIYYHAPINPDEEWQTFFAMIAGQAAIAIENKQLFERLKRSNEELEQRVNVRTADLLRLNAELNHANRAKDEFLANMSHELRTPLTGILGLSEAMQLNTYGQLEEKQVRALKNIETSGRHLLALINDILDLSKIEAGKFDIYPEMIGIDDTCRASLMFVKEQAQKKSITLDYQPAENVRSIFADQRRLKQILVNLLGNAVKFTPENGQVTLFVQADPKIGKIHFSVTDTGIGIAQEDLDRLFTPFTQVDGQLNRQYEGTGLGLVMVLRLAEMHGGNVRVESETGKGSCFTVSLPWQPVMPSASAPEPAPMEVAAALGAGSRGNILLVEDNETSVEAIGDYLLFQGYHLVVAVNGLDALIKVEEQTPDLILMDVQMPIMDGLEAIRRLRADARFATTPIIALTALAMTGDRERCLAAGASDYLSKPISLNALIQKIEKFLTK